MKAFYFVIALLVSAIFVSDACAPRTAQEPLHGFVEHTTPEEPELPAAVAEEQDPLLLEDGLMSTEPYEHPDLRRARVAVQVLGENHSRMRRLSPSSFDRRARYIFEAAQTVYHETGVWVDPVDIAIIWRFESGFRWAAQGDGGVSCGPTQIRTDYEGRPSCEELMTDPSVGLEWTAHKLVDLRLEYGVVRIDRYNGAGEGAMRYGLRHAAVKTLVERAIAGEVFDVSTYEFACEQLG
jgi:hypothetical protein